MPDGIDATALLLAVMKIGGEEKGVAFWKWLTVEHPGWGRDLAGRIDGARKRCDH